MAMNTVFLHLSEEAIKRLNKLRGWRKVSRSAILREAVEQYLERQQFPVRKAKGGRQRDENTRDFAGIAGVVTPYEL